MGVAGACAAVIDRSAVVAATTCRHSENSDVLPLASVAVAVRNFPSRPTAKVVVNDAFPLLSVVVETKPRNCCPSPLPEASHASLENSSIRNVVETVLFNVPDTMVADP